LQTVSILNLYYIVQMLHVVRNIFDPVSKCYTRVNFEVRWGAPCKLKQVYRRQYKAATRQSLKQTKIWQKMIFNMLDGILTPCARSRHWFCQVTAPCNVACGSGIMTVNSPSGSTLQYDTWLWNDMPLNSPKRSSYWNSTFGFHFHTSLQSTCHSVPVCEILSKSDHPRQKKWRHVDLQDGSQPSWFVRIQ